MAALPLFSFANFAQAAAQAQAPAAPAAAPARRSREEIVASWTEQVQQQRRALDAQAAGVGEWDARLRAARAELARREEGLAGLRREQRELEAALRRVAEQNAKDGGLDRALGEVERGVDALLRQEEARAAGAGTGAAAGNDDDDVDPLHHTAQFVRAQAFASARAVEEELLSLRERLGPAGEAILEGLRARAAASEAGDEERASVVGVVGGGNGGGDGAAARELAEALERLLASIDEAEAATRRGGGSDANHPL